MIEEQANVGKWLIGGLAGTVAVIGGLWLGAMCYIDYSMTHRGSTSIDEDAVENAQSYAAGQVYWLGPEFDVDADGDLEPLSRFSERRTSQTGDAQRELYVGYGQCDFPDYEGGCALPLSLTFEAPCTFIGDPSHIADIRGVEARDAGDHLYLLTRDYTIAIWGNRRYEAARSLVGANALAADIGPGDGLPRRPAGLCD